MTSIRVRPPSDDGVWTYEWLSAGGDGVWAVLHGGRVHHFHTYRLGAWLWIKLRQRREKAES